MAMASYHFAWDLRAVGFVSADIGGDPAWRAYARAIAGTFLFLVGVGLALAAREGPDWRRYRRRLAAIAAGAAAVTAVTWFAFPDSFIFFGILHCIAVASVLGLPFLRASLPLVGAAALACLAAPALFAGARFDAPWLLPLGLASYFPRTNDYVPLLPWFGAVLVGILAGRAALSRPGLVRFFAGPAPRPLAFAGRHSLAIYLIHQPVLFGMVWLAAWAVPPDRTDVFMQSCGSSCTGTGAETGADAALCTRICGCLADRTKAAGLWDGVMSGALPDPDRERYFALAKSCQAEAEPPD